MKNAKPTSVKEARHNAILDAAFELLIEKPTASLQEIAKHAGIGIATLHRYFENREHLMLKLGLRSISMVGETINSVPVDDGNLELYIPNLVEVLIPLGDKVYFLSRQTSLYFNKEIDEAEGRLKEQVRQMIQVLQQKGYLRADMSSEWILNVIYSLLFATWQDIQEGQIAKKSATSLLVETLYNGFKVNHP